MGWWPLAIVVLLFQQVYGQLVKNGNFESGNVGSEWYCFGCHLNVVSGGYSSAHALQVTNRGHDWDGPNQAFAMKRNTRYHVSVRIKELNDANGKLYQLFKIGAAYEYSSGNPDYPEIAVDRKMYKDRGWVTLSAFFITPDKGFVKSRLSVQGPDPGVNYLMDDFELNEVPEDRNWKAEANARIDQLRKSDIHVSVAVPSHVSNSDLEVQVRMTKHGYPFGSAAHEELINDGSKQKWRDLFFSMFNWETLASYYWKWSHGDRNHPDYTGADKAINLLHSHGVKVRGHNLFWDVEDKNPDWVLHLSGSQLQQTIDARIHYVLGVTKGKLEHWDVNNEALHGQKYEEITGDRHYNEKIYAKVHQIDPSVKLFLNDYSVVSDGAYTSAYLQQAKEFKAAKVGLYGLGVQCHFHDNTPPDPTLMKKNLDSLASSGYPLWATELDVWTPDENQRAEWLDTAVRVLFSHPAVEGIILWGFWGPQHWRGENAALVSGNDFHVNAAGRRFMDLLHQEWSTDVTHKLTQGVNFNVRGFHGDYEAIVKYKGSPVFVQKFSLGKQGASVHVAVPASLHPIQVPTSGPHTPQNPHPVDHINEHTIGQSHSGSSNQLTCTTRWSAFSSVGDDKYVETNCQDGEVLTGCSSQTKDKRSTRDGETIEMAGNVAKCRAYNAADASSPVQAVARCCKLTGMQCEYRQSGPSRDMLGERIETRCPNNYFATGCSVHNWMENLDGTFPTDHSCLAQNKDGHGNVESYAACCSAPHLSCHVKTSQPSGLHFGNEATVSCDQGYTPVGCSAISESGGASVVYINNDVCHAVNGQEKQPGDSGVVAYVTCCKA